MTDLVVFLKKNFHKGTSHNGKILGQLKKLEGLSCSQDFTDRFQKESSIKIVSFPLSNLSSPHSQIPKSNHFPLSTKKRSPFGA